MKHKAWFWTVGIIAVLAVAGGIGVRAQSWTPRHFRGVINDYTPIGVVPVISGTKTPMALGWEVRGPWSLTLDEDRDSANFSAAVTMEFSDPTNPANLVTNARMQHTHHIAVRNGTVTCPSTGVIEVTGPVTITKDGDPVPPALQGSTLVIDVTGGTLVPFSNITLTFKGPSATNPGATIHFGSQPLHGVVRRASDPDSRD